MRLSFLIILLAISSSIFGQKQELIQSIHQVIEGKAATVGVAVIYDNSDTLVIHNEHKYPLMSVFKFPQALALLDYMDKNSIDLDAQVFIDKSDLRENTYSPMRDKYPNGDFLISLKELIEYSVSQSDNNASDWLFDKMLGPYVTTMYLRNLGLYDFEIVDTERELEISFDKQYANWISPLEAARLLDVYKSTNLLSPKYKDFLDRALIETSTGLDKIKGLLPSEVVVAHKTGMSSRNDLGLKAADNDIAIVFLPNGKSFSIAVLITNSTEDNKTNAQIIAEISKLVYDYYVDQK